MKLNLSEPLEGAQRDYVAARKALLEALGLPLSNRDPLAEYSERLVTDIVGGKLAESRVQKDYDVTTADKKNIQVKYLANSNPKWVNEHHLKFTSDMHQYALVVFENFGVSAVLLFDKTGIAEVCRLLGKQHPNQETSLQLTQKNFKQILDNPDEFTGCGLQVFTFT